MGSLPFFDVMVTAVYGGHTICLKHMTERGERALEDVCEIFWQGIPMPWKEGQDGLHLDLGAFEDWGEECLRKIHGARIGFRSADGVCLLLQPETAQ